MSSPSLPSRFTPLWARDLDAAATPVRWVWHGYLARGSITLLTSPWKAGKTTLLTVLLSRLKTGGVLAGLPVEAGRAVVVSEEGRDLWARRARRFDFGDQVCFLCRPFRALPRLDEWRDLLDHLADLHARFDLALAVIDPLASFLPGRVESDAGGILEALLPVQRLADRGLAALLLHHPRRQRSPEGQAARGSGALSGFADILLEMSFYEPPGSDDRRRKLLGFSRFEETPRGRVIALTEDGTDFLCHGDLEEEAFGGGWALVRRLLEEAPGKRTRAELLADWPAEAPRPDPATLWRWLEKAAADGLVRRDGTGRKNAPYRYWLAGQEARWLEDPLRLLNELQEEALREALERHGPYLDNV